MLDTLWRLGIGHAPFQPICRVGVDGGVVRLAAYVRDHEEWARVEEALGRTPGVIAVEGEWIADDRLEGAVAQRLAGAVPQAWHGPTPLRVTVVRGIVELDGTVSSDAVRQEAQAQAAAVPRVRAVVNHVHVPGTQTAAARGSPVCLPRIGSLVYGEDGAIGHVDAVLVDPCSRRVEALVVVTHVPMADGGPAAAPRKPNPGEPYTRERVVVPVEEVALVTDSVILHLGRVSAAALVPFREADVSRPPTDWFPPLDYRATDVRLVSASRQPGTPTLPTTYTEVSPC